MKTLEEKEAQDKYVFTDDQVRMIANAIEKGISKGIENAISAFIKKTAIIGDPAWVILNRFVGSVRIGKSS